MNGEWFEKSLCCYRHIFAYIRLFKVCQDKNLDESHDIEIIK